MNTLDRIIAGDVAHPLEEIDYAIEAWHRTETDLPVYEWLGFTQEEYTRFVGNSNELFAIMEEHKAGHLTFEEAGPALDGDLPPHRFEHVYNCKACSKLVADEAQSPFRKKNLMTFYGSCGHTTVEEIEDEMWLRYANETREQMAKAHPIGLTTKEGFAPNWSVECSDGSVRMVYVYPLRACDCVNCFKAEWEAVDAMFSK